MSVEETIEQFVVHDILRGKREGIGVDESLISAGLLDSLTLLQLIAFVEDEYSLSIADEEMVAENFETIRSIKMLIERKRSSV